MFDPDELPAVAAATPILADASKASFRRAGRTAQRLHPRAEFYLVVRGDSMCSIGYKSGDILRVWRNREPRDGDIVIARIGTEITVKCFRRMDDTRSKPQPRAAADHELRAPTKRDQQRDRRLGSRRRGRRGSDRPTPSRGEPR